jgi:hypothetical protein
LLATVSSEALLSLKAPSGSKVPFGASLVAYAYPVNVGKTTDGRGWNENADGSRNRGRRAAKIRRGVFAADGLLRAHMGLVRDGRGESEGNFARRRRPVAASRDGGSGARGDSACAEAGGSPFFRDRGTAPGRNASARRKTARRVENGSRSARTDGQRLRGRSAVSTEKRNADR